MFRSNKSNPTSFLQFLLSTWFTLLYELYEALCYSPYLILKATNYRHCQSEWEKEQVRHEHTCQYGFPLAGWRTFRIFIHKLILNFTEQLKMFNTIPESSCRKSGAGFDFLTVCLHAIEFPIWTLALKFNAAIEMLPVFMWNVLKPNIFRAWNQNTSWSGIM